MLVELTESFQGARKHVQVGSSIKSQSGNSFPKRQQNNNRSQDSQYKKEIRTCFKCNHQGHVASYCPTSQNVKFKPGKLGLCIEQTQNQVSDKKSEGVKRYVSGVTVRLPGVSGIDHTEKKVSGIEIVDGKVNEQSVSVLRDTGSSTVFVHGKYVKPAKFTGEVRMISLANGIVRECPEAWINIVTLYITGTVLALVLESPFADLIVGNLVNTSIPKSVGNQIAIQNSNELTFSNYLGEKSTELTECPCSAVQTRKQRAKELKEVEKEKASGKVYTNDTPFCETVEINNPENTFSFCSRQELIETQKSDSSLDKVRSLVINEPSGDFSSCFVFRTTILYRLFKTNLGEAISQIVVPNSMRKTSFIFRS
jgi:hypothetical protein